MKQAKNECNSFINKYILSSSLLNKECFTKNLTPPPKEVPNLTSAVIPPPGPSTGHPGPANQPDGRK
ncbi:MAG: hypothetical protein C5B47_06980 [Verrucomicrobia bacterium]|nr:MAG: hypothetical protein C5B47_06980 [Verrucomicrobiota bacterium]